MMTLTKKEVEFNNFRFEGLEWRECSNNYISTKRRVSADETKIILKVGDNHLIPTQFGYALILDKYNVVFLKNWQVSQNWYGNEVILDKKYFIVKKWGEHNLFLEDENQLIFETWVADAKAQENNEDEYVRFKK